MTDDLDTRLRALAADAPTALDLAQVHSTAGRRRRRRQAGAVALTVVAVGLVGVGATSVGGPRPDVQPAVAPSPSAPDDGTTPRVFAQREPLPSCGSYRLPQGASGPPAAATACLERGSRDGRGAELVVSRPTVEGRPIVTHTRALPDGGSEVYTDSTADAQYGDPVWTLARCEGLRTGCGPAQVLLVARAAAGDCPDGDTSLADYVDFLQVGGEQYTGGGEAPPGTRLGETVLEVACELSEGARGGQPRSGDSAFVPQGTPVRQVLGFDPRFRLAAQVDGRTLLFQVFRPEAARPFPGVREHLRRVVLRSQQDGTTEVGRLDDPAAVQRIADDLAYAPYDPHSPATYDLRLELVLDDGSVVDQAYDTRRGRLHPGVRLSAESRAAVEAARR